VSNDGMIINDRLQKKNMNEALVAYFIILSQLSVVQLFPFIFCA
jgi:hypothetical protein